MGYEVEFQEDVAVESLMYKPGNGTITDGHYMIVRIDGRNFHKVTENMDKPYDKGFMRMMDAISKYIMKESGFRIIVAYTQSDEISFLIHESDVTFGRKVRKILSLLPGLASAFMTVATTEPAPGAEYNIVTFDARIFSTSNHTNIHEYFRERMRDAHRNFVNANMYWALRAKVSGAKASSIMSGMKVDAMTEMLKEVYDKDLDEQPAGEKYGRLFYWEDYKTMGHNPQTGEYVEADRRRIATRDTGYSDIIYQIEKVIHFHHTEGDPFACQACEQNVPADDYCRNSHTAFLARKET